VTIKIKVSRVTLLQNVLKNLVPLALVNLVNQELEIIKEADNVLPINEFNALIHEQIKDQPAPFIYERLGDRYRDFFIDEFQDTSGLQWNNLIPLIDNAISQAQEGEEPGSLLLVGDAKQSIYRWRGGLPEQFMDLYGDESPFALSEEKIVENLETNFRSCQEIIEFNNEFFSFVSEYFGDENHEHLYKIGNRQKTPGKKGGYVKIEFLDPSTDDDSKDDSDPYARKVYTTVEELLTLGYRLKDLCVLTRKKKEGMAISEYLLEKGIPVISEETLLLTNAPSVQCLIHILQLSISAQHEEVKIQFLEFLHEHLAVPEEKHGFFQSLIHEPMESLSEKLKSYSINFNFNVLHSLSLFESFEYSIDALKLETTADAFLTSFMDLVFSFGQRPDSGKSAFLDYWETEKERASISENKSTNAVNIMTIHKAKGLEFPVVLFPYANLDIYSEIEARAWYPLQEAGFDHVLIHYNKGVADYGEQGAQLLQNRRNTLELDNINLLYVALTRAVEQLYIFAKDQPLKDTPTTYNLFLKTYLQCIGRWDDAIGVYNFGLPEKLSSEGTVTEMKSVEIPYLVSSPETHNIKVVSSEMDSNSFENLQSVNMGNLLHDAMALVKYSEDIEPVLEDLSFQLRDEPKIFSEIKKMMLAIITHPELKPLFDTTDRIHNERDIITPESVLRPDRINIHEDNTVTIIDYKTGAPKEVYEYQIGGYAMALQDMGFTIREKLLVYCGKDAIMINKT
jgi:superfamily I DNA/RNA helicase